MPTATPAVLSERVDQLRVLLPEIFAEGKIDLEKFQSAVGNAVDDRPERYSFNWAGKRDAIRLLQVPSRATLKPVRAESVDFDTTQNLFIEGDNLEVLKLLYKPYFGRVKMIYIDPPYNTGKDFIYPDNFADPLDTYLRLTGQEDGNGNLLTSNPETSGRYHSAWLSMMYPRLFLARQLLREDGIIFVSIDDHEVHNLRIIMNEVFGEENFVATVIWQKVYSPKNTARHFSEDHDYILAYARNAQTWMPTLLPRTAEMDARYSNPDNDRRGDWKSSGLDARNYYSRGIYAITCPSGRVISGPPPGSYWRYSEAKFKQLDADKRIWWGEDGNSTPAVKRFKSEVKQGKVPQTLWLYADVGHTQEAKKELLKYVTFEHTDNVLDTVKPTRLIRRMLQIATSPWDNDIVMDFFAGSGSTAHGVLNQNQEDGGNRRFVCVQIPEPLPVAESVLRTIADIGKQRIRQVVEELKDAVGKKLALDADEAPPDLGFRVLRLTTSNRHLWEPLPPDTDPSEYVRQLELLRDPLLPGWKLEDVIFEVALGEGFSSASYIEKLGGVPTATVCRVTDADRGQSFLVCLDDSFTLETVQALSLGKDDLFVCRDIALDDTLAANLALQCRLKTI